MDARTIIACVRNGATPNREELNWFAQGLADGTVSDAQAGAFAMAVVLNGLGEEGRVALTQAMRDTGDVLSWDLPGPILDKHSTGGVGDTVSLILAPMLAAAGAYVPMISGRGLGHSGGTLDKLEAIPGVSTEVSEARFRATVAEVGCAIVAASADLAPADRRLYAVRDVTATVESVDLITASILSKKLAAGLDSLVLDVKLGRGAFMKSVGEARALARALASTATGAGCPTRAVISDMDQPLASAIGNAVEVRSVLDVLTGADQTSRLYRLTTDLGGTLLALGGLAGDTASGAESCQAHIASGAAAERFAQMVAAMGGPSSIEAIDESLPKAPVTRAVSAEADGYVQKIDGQALGMAVVDLGGGRRVDGDQIDPSVGLTEVICLGTRVESDTLLGVIHAADDAAAARATQAVRAAITLGHAPASEPPLIHEVIR